MIDQYNSPCLYFDKKVMGDHSFKMVLTNRLLYLFFFINVEGTLHHSGDGGPQVT